MRIFIPLEPTGQMRARSTTKEIFRNGKKIAIPIVYKAKIQRTREAKMAAIIHNAMIRDGWQKRTEPVWLRVVAIIAIPKSFSKAKRQRAINREIFPEVKPDLSNIIKQVEDVCQDLLFDDDKRICKIESEKVYGESGGLEIEIWDLK